MQGFDYSIDNDHLIVTCNNQVSWNFIGSMKGVCARIAENPGNILLEINFPERGLVVFQIPYNSAIEAGKVLNKANQLIKDLTKYCQKKEGPLWFSIGKPW